ncbi:MAG TPA: ATP-binding cassette domain-containing protein [Vicinamibacterales bacterium]|nr:ATP-binding cassette domain-containing protein [Vicinamibacterales bacterium]
MTLALSAVTKRFGRHTVLNQVWLRARPGELVGLVGRNGAGKTTTMRIAAGLVRPDSGTVECEGAAPPAFDVRYFAGESTLPARVRAAAWASLFGVEEVERRRIGRLSRGSRQALGLRSVLGRPGADLLLLDEPWEGLDPAASRWLTDRLAVLKGEGVGGVISSHRLHDLAGVCDRFVFLRDGRSHAVQTGSLDGAVVERLLAEFDRHA